jgi:hypothetical protein
LSKLAPDIAANKNINVRVRVDTGKVAACCFAEHLNLTPVMAAQAAIHATGKYSEAVSRAFPIS